MRPKIQSLASLKRELSAAASGARKAPRDAAQDSFSSVDAVLAALTAENCELLKILKARGPQSTGSLAHRTQRTPSELAAALRKLRAAGFVSVGRDGRRRTWTAILGRLLVEVDPYERQPHIRCVTARRRLR